jgi:hypothetical protein
MWLTAAWLIGRMLGVKEMACPVAAKPISHDTASGTTPRLIHGWRTKKSGIASAAGTNTLN